MAAPNAGVVYRRKDVSAFRNGAITYTVYATPEAIRFEVAERTGDYSTFMRAHVPTPVSGKVFSLRILHGKCPKDASYRYRIDIGKQDGTASVRQQDGCCKNCNSADSEITIEGLEADLV